MYQRSPQLTLTFSGVHKPHILRVHMIHPPLKVTLDTKSLQEGTDWTYDRDRAKLIIHTREYETGKYLIEF